MDYDEIVSRMRAWSVDERLGDGMLLRRAADAITEIQARVAELSSQRDTAMEMVNVQDNQIDALQADLAAARFAYEAEKDETSRLRGTCEQLRADLAAARAALREINKVARAWPYAGCTCGEIATDALKDVP